MVDVTVADAVMFGGVPTVIAGTAMYYVSRRRKQRREYNDDDVDLRDVGDPHLSDVIPRRHRDEGKVDQAQ